MGATVVSAAAYAAAFRSPGVPALAWVALVPLLVALRSATPRRAVALAWLWTVVAAYGVGAWFPRAVSVYFEQPAIVGVALFFGVSTLMAATFHGAFALAYRAMVQRMDARCAPLLASAAWVAAELGRATLLGGNPWALAGYSQVGLRPLAQIADVAGVFGLGFVVVLVNACAAELWCRRPGPERRRALVGAALAAGLVLGSFGYGAWRLRALEAAAPTSPGRRVGIAQADLDLGSQWRVEHYGRNLALYLALTEEAVRVPEKPGLVIWPESALTFFLPEEPQYRAAIARVTGPGDVELLAGGPRAGRRGGRRVYLNSAFVLAPRGTLTATYEKRQLLPFAEYLPFAGIDLLRRRFERVRTFAPGVRDAPVRTRAGRAGVVICNEAFYGAIAAQRAREGAEWLVNLANDTWLGDRTFSEMAFAMVRLRAIEQRRFLVRASTSGPSGVVDPTGRVVAAGPYGRAVIAGTVHPRRGLTVYARFGDAFAYACVAVAVASLLVCGRRGPAHARGDRGAAAARAIASASRARSDT